MLLSFFESLIARLSGIVPLVLVLGCAADLGARAGNIPGHKGLTDNSLASVTAEELQARITDFKSLGVKWVRFELDWSVIQPTGPETYDLRQQDMVIKALTEAGIHILGLVDYTPGWANGGALNKYHPPVDNAAFAAFAAYLVRHYCAMGVHDWEVWNEENAASFWGPAANATAYAALLKQTYIAIHGEDPHATVMFGGLAQPSDGHGDISSLRFFKALYDAGAKPYFDAVADHPYFSPASLTDENGNNWQKLFHTTTSFLGLMAAYHDLGKKIWVTEVGAPTGGRDSYGTVISEEAQSTMIRQIYDFAADARYPWIGPVFWYNYRDFAGKTSADVSSECCFGLARSDGSKKPSYGAYQAAPDAPGP
jgi:hypothetical protein